MRRISAFGFVAALHLMLVASALAQSGVRTEGDRAGAQGVYEAEVPVRSQSESERTLDY